MLAHGYYSTAFSWTEKVKNMTPEVDKLRVTILQNMSVCTNNSRDFEATIKQCTKAIDINGAAFKAIYFRSLA